jgi:hypothetical protein
MIRVTIELISAVDPSRNRVLGTMEICNDGTGDERFGNYNGKLMAEYGGRNGRVENFNRTRQSVWSLVGAFLKLWGHTRHPASQTTEAIQGQLSLEE